MFWVKKSAYNSREKEYSRIKRLRELQTKEKEINKKLKIIDTVLEESSLYIEFMKFNKDHHFGSYSTYDMNSDFIYRIKNELRKGKTSRINDLITFLIMVKDTIEDKSPLINELIAVQLEIRQIKKQLGIE